MKGNKPDGVELTSDQQGQLIMLGYLLGVIPSYLLLECLLKHNCTAEHTMWTVGHMVACVLLAVMWPLSLPAVMFIVFLVWAGTTPGL